MTHPPDSGYKQSFTQHTKHMSKKFWLPVHRRPSNKNYWTIVRANSSALAGTGSLGHWGLFFLPACTRHASGHCVHVLTGGHPRIYWQPLAKAVCAPLGRFCIWDEPRAIIHEAAVKAHAHSAFPLTHARREAHMNHGERVHFPRPPPCKP